jgi:hypothetical protein
MNKTADNDKDAEDARKVAAFRERQRAVVERVKESLAAWIDSEDGNAANFGANYNLASRCNDPPRRTQFNTPC